MISVFHSGCIKIDFPILSNNSSITGLRPIFFLLNLIHYFITSFFIIAFGICLSNNSMIPIIPTDIFPRDLSAILKKAI